MKSLKEIQEEEARVLAARDGRKQQQQQQQQQQPKVSDRHYNCTNTRIMKGKSALFKFSLHNVDSLMLFLWSSAFC